MCVCVLLCGGDLAWVDCRYWPIKDVFIDKYAIEEEEAEELASFLQPMLEYDPEVRATAEECLKHRWLQPKGEKGKEKQTAN